MVIERVGTTITMYIDGVSAGSVAFTGSLFDASAIRNVRNVWDDTSGFSAQQCTNIRIAKRALYNGTVRKLPTYPVAS